MDPVFEQEQKHLDETYAHLQSIELEQLDRADKVAHDAVTDKNTMAEELTVDLSDFDTTLETVASIESLNRIVDAYNMASASTQDRLMRARLLLAQPYFAKVVLRFSPDKPPRDIYLGVCGMTDNDGHTFIVDWRSPIADTYYSQQFGSMSYVAHGRTIHTDLQLRRQFDITGDVLHAYFDTTVAIEDPLLLKALSQQHGSRMKAITATIQKEQNTVIRHEDVPVLLVRGIAGSGKTSVLLQRIAYLLYQHRDDLRPDQLHLITPNPVFSRYIDHVLPDMGEHNPQTTTWAGIGKLLGIPARDKGQGDETVRMLRRIDEVCEHALLTPEDCRAVRLKDDILIPAATVGKLARRFANVKSSSRQCRLVSEELHDLLDQKTARDAANEDIQAEIIDMSVEEQCRHFGFPIDPFDEDQLRDATLTYLRDLYAPVHASIDACSWITTRRLASRLIGTRGLKPIERAYLKIMFAGTADLDARYVMIDEVQDYTEAQLMLLARLYPHAHFLLLGDPNQAIYPETVSYDDIKNVFEATHGEVSQCDLMTSYRSTPEITNLFAKLTDKDDRIEITSVQRPGKKPAIYPFIDRGSYRTLLTRTILEAEDHPRGLTAVIVANKHSYQEIHSILGDMTPRMLTERSTLPDNGVFFMELNLAKGLEFDRVIIPDARADHYGDDALSRHRLYTAISRATGEVTIMANGPLTPLLTPLLT